MLGPEAERILRNWRGSKPVQAAAQSHFGNAGDTCWTCTVVSGEGIEPSTYSETAIAQSTRHAHPYPFPRFPPLEAFGRQPSEPAAPSLIGPASETLHITGNAHSEDIESAASR